MNGPQSTAACLKRALPVKARIARLYCGTSFQHALYGLMRNLLKIPRRASGVNVAGTGRSHDRDWAGCEREQDASPGSAGSRKFGEDAQDCPGFPARCSRQVCVCGFHGKPHEAPWFHQVTQEIRVPPGILSARLVQISFFRSADLTALAENKLSTRIATSPEGTAENSPGHGPISANLFGMFFVKTPTKSSS